MIKRFRHRGLEQFYRTGSVRGIQPAHAERIGRMLVFLDRAAVPDDLDIPGWGLHPLKGRMKGYWALTVSGNWRLVFRFSRTDVDQLDYVDYH